MYSAAGRMMFISVIPTVVTCLTSSSSAEHCSSPTAALYCDHCAAEMSKMSLLSWDKQLDYRVLVKEVQGLIKKKQYTIKYFVIIIICYNILYFIINYLWYTFFVFCFCLEKPESQLAIINLFDQWKCCGYLDKASSTDHVISRGNPFHVNKSAFIRLLEWLNSFSCECHLKKSIKFFLLLFCKTFMNLILNFWFLELEKSWTWIQKIVKIIFYIL